MNTLGRHSASTSRVRSCTVSMAMALGLSALSVLHRPVESIRKSASAVHRSLRRTFVLAVRALMNGSGGAPVFPSPEPSEVVFAAAIASMPCPLPSGKQRRAVGSPARCWPSPSTGSAHRPSWQSGFFFFFRLFHLARGVLQMLVGVVDLQAEPWS